jgi:UDP-glucose 4-epimerase
MKYFVTGGAGFIGSNLVDRLLAEGNDVVVYDNFSTGFEEFLAVAQSNPRLRIVRGDLLDGASLANALEGTEFVFHLAANADVRFGTSHPERDLEQNTIATFNVLEAMRQHGINRIAFSSSGSIYGEPAVFPTPETCPFPMQTSLYGASKLACEGLISAYSEGFGFKAWIFRFVSVLGERYTHGHVFDFLKKLKADPSRLEILGDGHQRKSYMHVHDCIDGMLLAIRKSADKTNIFNLGTDAYCEVRDSVGWITAALKINPNLVFSGGQRGWIGDSPFIYLDSAKIRALGWQPKLTINDGILRTLSWLEQNSWIYRRRG